MPLTDEDRARLVRVFAVADAAYEYVNAPYDLSAGTDSLALKAETVVTEAVDALEPGDLALLARLAGLGEGT